MRILIITSEEWNDYVYGNGVLTNWFTDFNAEFAQIYTSPGLPINNICNKYFQITDSQMLKSILGWHRAGGVVIKAYQSDDLDKAKQNAQRKGIYKVMKYISIEFNTFVQLIRDFIWLSGRYNIARLNKFVKDFDPDIVFCPRYISPKLMRLEKIVHNMTKAPFIGFTADDEASIPNYGSLLSRVRRKFIHKHFSNHISIYSHYFTFSEDQAYEYKLEYGIETSVLLKCGDFNKNYIQKNVGTPIKLVYAGHLYCNRWKSLYEIGKALQIINKDEICMTLDIYTQDKITKEQANLFSECSSIFLKGSVTPYELKEIYKDADIAIHVESLDKYNRMVTRYSFSTKIVDLMASSCAIFAICWEFNAGYKYLKNNDIAFCCSNYQGILSLLQSICDNPFIITEYQRKVYDFGRNNLNRKKIQNQLMDVFKKLTKV